MKKENKDKEEKISNIAKEKNDKTQEEKEQFLEWYTNLIKNYKRLSAEEERELFRRYKKNGDKEALEKILTSHLELVVKEAKRHVASNFIPIEDLIGLGNIGLIVAANKFDLRKKKRFSTYAKWWIKQSMNRARETSDVIKIPVKKLLVLDKYKRVKRDLEKELGREPSLEEIAERLNVTKNQLTQLLKLKEGTLSLSEVINDEGDKPIRVEDVIFSKRNVNIEDKIFNSYSDILRESLKCLSEKEKYVIVKRYGLDGKDEHTLNEIAEDLSLSRERVRQLERKALQKLEKELLSKFKGEALTHLLN